MLRTDLLKGKIAERGTSQRQVAHAIGITEKTFYQKMKKDGFLRRETEEIRAHLKLSLVEFDTIFFYPGGAVIAPRTAATNTAPRRGRPPMLRPEG